MLGSLMVATLPLFSGVTNIIHAEEKNTSIRLSQEHVAYEQARRR